MTTRYPRIARRLAPVALAAGLLVACDTPQPPWASLGHPGGVQCANVRGDITTAPPCTVSSPAPPVELQPAEDGVRISATSIVRAD